MSGDMDGVMEGEETTRRPQLPALTSLRAVTALMVFVFHLNRWQVLDLPLAGAGYVGVTFFFVLSGFILTWSARPDASLRTFWLARTARILPNHLLVLLLALILPVVAERGTPWWGWVVSTGLMQSWFGNPTIVFAGNGVAWSLSCEAAFYAGFPFLWRWLRRSSMTAVVTVAVAAWAAAGSVVVALSQAGGEIPMVVGMTSPVLRAPEFLAGMVVARAVLEQWRPRWSYTVGVGVMAVIGAAFASAQPALNVWATPVVAMLIAAVAVRSATGSWWLHWRPLVWAGEASFAFYLCHELVIVNLQPLTGTGLWAAALALVVSGLVAGALLILVERPGRRRLQIVGRAVLPHQPRP